MCIRDRWLILGRLVGEDGPPPLVLAVASALDECNAWHTEHIESVAGEQMPSFWPCLVTPRAIGPLRFREGEWLRRDLIQVELADDGSSPCRDGGHYLVLGSLGAAGAERLARMLRGRAVTVHWVHTAQAQDPEVIAACARLRDGAQVLYTALDADDARTLCAHLRDAIERDRHAAMLHGVVFSAVDGECNDLQAEFALGLAITTTLRQSLVPTPAFVLAHSESALNASARVALNEALALRVASEWRCPGKVLRFGKTSRSRYSDDDGLWALQMLLTTPFEQMVFDEI